MSDSAEVEAIRKMPNVMVGLTVLVCRARDSLHMQNVWPVHKFIHPDYKPEAQHPKRDFVEKRAVASDIYRKYEAIVTQLA